MQETDQETIQKELETVRRIADIPPNVDIEINNVGWTSRVYIVRSGEIVFKFPRTDDVRKEYRHEIEAYTAAASFDSDVLVPKMHWVHPDMDYVGYRGIQGTTLDLVVEKFTLEEKKTLGTQLGRFLSVFHTIPVENPQGMTLKDEIQEYGEKLAMGEKSLVQYFSEHEMSRIRSLITDEYPSQMKRLGFHQAYCHGDLGFWNMVVTKDRQLGLIDFGDAGHYDNSIDFAGLTDDTILNAALDAYENDVSLEKIQLRRKIIPVLDLPFHIGKKDQDGIEQTLHRIRTITLNEKTPS